MEFWEQVPPHQPPPIQPSKIIASSDDQLQSKKLLLIAVIVIIVGILILAGFLIFKIKGSQELAKTQFPANQPVSPITSNEENRCAGPGICPGSPNQTLSPEVIEKLKEIQNQAKQ